MIRRYFEMLIAEGFPDATGKMKQFASWFTHGVEGGARLRKAIYEEKSAEEIVAAVNVFFARPAMEREAERKLSVESGYEARCG
jgi:tRNA-dihydrouridine synthase